MPTKNLYMFVIATPMSSDDFWKNSKAAKFLSKLSNIEFKVIFDNKKGLSEIYNSFLVEKYKNYHIIFVHDDVIIEDLFLEDKLDKAFGRFSIVGLAGSKTCDPNALYAAWHLMAPRTDFVGEVTHSNGDYVWTNVFGPSDGRALVVDGLFIAVNVADALKNNLKFDEQFKFHHYDIDFCLSANQKKVKVGVEPVRVVHFGLGNSMNSEEWDNSNILFKKKWGK